MSYGTRKHVYREKLATQASADKLAQYCPTVTFQTKYDEARHMKATEWWGKRDIRVNHHRAVPRVTDDTDVILKVTNTCICGSDLHLYLGFFKGMQPGDVMGHEFMGTIHEAGSKVSKHKTGNRVVACFDIGCGQCPFCKDGMYSCCDCTNPSVEEAELYGYRTGGFYGYSHRTGGWQGGQAVYVRVPLADVNLLAVPNSLRDEQVILLSDILPTAWWANECARTGKGDTVAIWGAGPVGTLAAHCAQNRGAKRVILIDQYAYRLEHAQKHLPGIEVIDFSKGVRIGVVGVYAQDTNGYHIGAFMEKGQSTAAGQTPCQKYWPELLKKVEKGELHPEMVITHQLALDDAPYAYQIFNDKLDNCKKCVLHPDWKSTRKPEE
ncbi:hypothetical protein WJX72_010423 [[Myrmecia] bisecta]|uniref:Alcohol dehydrogenase-like N-terminal domain-containing protein n=1 Tax=[Myrmecia] bisecta TaxID=41462 RepID=A0AAW1Q7P5_9CHLO